MQMRTAGNHDVNILSRAEADRYQSRCVYFISSETANGRLAGLFGSLPSENTSREPECRLLARTP